MEAARDEFVDASTEMWREIDREHMSWSGDFSGWDDIRKRVRKAWEQYRDLIDKEFDRDRSA